MGIFLFATANGIVTSVSLRALLGGLFILLLILPLLAVVKSQKQFRQILFFVLVGVILACSSVIFAASLAHVNNEPRFGMSRSAI